MSEVSRLVAIAWVIHSKASSDQAFTTAIYGMHANVTKSKSWNRTLTVLYQNIKTSTGTPAQQLQF